MYVWEAEEMSEISHAMEKTADCFAALRPDVPAHDELQRPAASVQLLLEQRVEEEDTGVCVHARKTSFSIQINLRVTRLAGDTSRRITLGGVCVHINHGNASLRDKDLR